MIPGPRPAARSLRATPLPVSERVSALRDAVAILMSFVKRSSTAANRGSGATLRRLRPPYHAGAATAAHRGDLQLQTNRDPLDNEPQSNRELTDCSACVYRIALLSSSPTDRIVSLSNRRS